MTAFFVYFVILKILPNPSFVKEGLDVNKGGACMRDELEHGKGGCAINCV